jgi:putative sigma-54 modulation protein
MNINFEYDQVQASARLEELTARKIVKLVDKYDFIVRSSVFFANENTSEPDTGKICKIRLSVPGGQLFAEASHGEFEQSVAEVIDDLERQLRKKKGKMKSF